MESQFKTKLLLATFFALAIVFAQADSLELELKSSKDYIQASYSLDAFDDVFAPRHLIATEYNNRTKYGSLVARLSYTDRFNMEDYAAELELYPKITKDMYLYLGYGVGFNNNLFPRQRIGAEVFHRVFKQFEASAGFRYLEFPQNNITIYTGALGYYVGNYWFLFRTFQAPKFDDVAGTYAFKARRYFKDSYQFVELNVEQGTSFADVDLEEALITSSFRVGLATMVETLPNTFLRFSAEYRNEELPSNRDKRINRVSLGIGIRRTF